MVAETDFSDMHMHAQSTSGFELSPDSTVWSFSSSIVPPLQVTKSWWNFVKYSKQLADRRKAECPVHSSPHRKFQKCNARVLIHPDILKYEADVLLDFRSQKVKSSKSPKVAASSSSSEKSSDKKTAEQKWVEN